MKTLCQSLFYLSLLTIPLLAQADTKIAGVELADSYQLGGKSLTLKVCAANSFSKYISVHCIPVRPVTTPQS